MKQFKKNETFLLISIFILAVFVRFYNFENRLTFGPEQAISLLVSADYINEKFSFLGLPSTQRTTSFGHIIFYPPIFNYSLVPLLLLFNYEVIPITASFALLNILTGFLLYLITKRIFNKTVGIFALVFFLFNELMIYHSLFIWSVNFLPLLNTLILYPLYKVFKKSAGKWDYFLIGLLASLSFGVEYLYIFTALIIYAFITYFSKNKLLATLLFLGGAILGIFPTIIFDLTHGFYHLKTLWQYFLDTIFFPGQSKISYYHFLQFWPLLSICLAYSLFKIYQNFKIATAILLISYVGLNLISGRISFNSPQGMYPNLNYQKINQAAHMIALDNPQSFNVVMTFDFDSRAHPLRYLLKYKYGLKTLGVEDYPNAQNLYIFAPSEYPTQNTSLWEISSFNGAKVEQIGTIDEFSVFKAVK